MPLPLLVPITLLTFHVSLPPVQGLPGRPTGVVREVRGATVDSGGFLDVTLTPAQGALLPLLRSEADKARKLGRTAVVDIGATWCGPCHILDRALRRSELATVMKQMYIIHLDYDLWQDTLVKQGIDLSGFPRLVALAADGQPSGEPWRSEDIWERQPYPPVVEARFLKALPIFFEDARARFARATPLPPPIDTVQVIVTTADLARLRTFLTATAGERANPDFVERMQDERKIRYPLRWTAPARLKRSVLLLPNYLAVVDSAYSVPGIKAALTEAKLTAAGYLQLCLSLSLAKLAEELDSKPAQGDERVVIDTRSVTGKNAMFIRSHRQEFDELVRQGLAIGKI